MLCCRMETSSFCALPAWPGVILREKGLKRASGDSTGGKALLAAGWAWSGGRTVAEGGSGALPSCLGCFLHLSIRVSIDVEKPVAKAVPLPPLSRETGSVSWDYMQHLKENIYRIYIHIPFALFSGGSPVPSLPPARTSSPPRLLPLAFPPSCHNTRLCERNNVYSPSRMGGLEMKRAASPSPRPRAALGGGRRRNSCRNADGDGRRGDSPDEGINIHVGGEREERKRKKGLGTGIIQGPSFFSVA